MQSFFGQICNPVFYSFTFRFCRYFSSHNSTVPSASCHGSWHSPSSPPGRTPVGERKLYHLPCPLRNLGGRCQCDALPCLYMSAFAAVGRETDDRLHPLPLRRVFCYMDTASFHLIDRRLPGLDAPLHPAADVQQSLLQAAQIIHDHIRIQSGHIPVETSFIITDSEVVLIPFCLSYSAPIPVAAPGTG